MSSYQPWYVGQTYPAWDIPLARDGGVEDITTVSMANFSLTFRNAQGVDTAGTGTFSLKTANPAEIYYKPSPADVAATFSGSLIIKANFPPSNGVADEVVYDPISFVISAS